MSTVIFSACSSWRFFRSVASLQLQLELAAFFTQHSVSCCCCFLGSGLFAYFHNHISLLLGTPKETPPVSDSIELPYANPLSAFSRISARFMACQETRHDSQTYTHAHAQRQMTAGHWAKMKTLLTGSWRKRTEKVIHPAKRPL